MFDEDKWLSAEQLDDKYNPEGDVNILHWEDIEE